MFGLRAKRRDTHYREAMRQLQPFANEANALWLSGRYRGIQALVPGMSAQPRIRPDDARESTCTIGCRPTRVVNSAVARDAPTPVGPGSARHTTLRSEESS